MLFKPSYINNSNKLFKNTEGKKLQELNEALCKIHFTIIYTANCLIIGKSFVKRSCYRFLKPRLLSAINIKKQIKYKRKQMTENTTWHGTKLAGKQKEKECRHI